MKKNILGLIALIIAVSASAFTTVSHKHSSKSGRDDTNWYYTSSLHTSAAILNAANYTQTVQSGCQSTGLRPCFITVDAANQSDLQTFLNGETSDDVVANAPEKKP